MKQSRRKRLQIRLCRSRALVFHYSKCHMNRMWGEHEENMRRTWEDFEQVLRISLACIYLSADRNLFSKTLCVYMCVSSCFSMFVFCSSRGGECPPVHHFLFLFSRVYPTWKSNLWPLPKFLSCDIRFLFFETFIDASMSHVFRSGMPNIHTPSHLPSPPFEDLSAWYFPYLPQWFPKEAWESNFPFEAFYGIGEGLSVTICIRFGKRLRVPLLTSFSIYKEAKTKKKERMQT